MYGHPTTVEFRNAAQREDALKLLSAAVQRIRTMRGFQAAYYLDVDELRIIMVAIFDSEEDLAAIQQEDETLRTRAREIGVKFPRTEQYRVMAFATSGAP
jgi:heme-degrading monooxygenase HmoA